MVLQYQQMYKIDVSTKIDTFGYLDAIFHKIAQESQQLSENEKVNKYAEVLKNIRRELENLFRQVESKMKAIISTVEVHDWVEQVREFIEKMYVDNATSEVQRYISGFINLLRLKRMGEDYRVNSFTQQSPLKRYFSEIKEVNRMAIDQVLSKVETRQRVICHIKIKAQIELKLEDIFRHNYDALKVIVDDWKSQTYLEKAKLLHAILKKQFKELTLSVLNIVDSKFRIFSASQNVDSLSKKLQELLQQNQNKLLPQISQQFLALYEQCKKTLIYDIRNNMSKTFSLQLVKNDQLRYKIALSQTQKFDFKFTFVNNLDIYIKSYHSWYRGKQQLQNKTMYLKHWSIINYFVLTVPHGIVQYFSASEDQAGKTMRFTMERGQRCFTNFQQGYAYFTSLNVEGKIRLILDLAESLIILEQHGINHNDITIRNTVPIKGAFKLIDFDVARMFDVDFDASSYPSSAREQIKEYRSQIIKLSRALMKMQLKQQRIISKSDPNRPSVQVENINRLSEYYFLPNENAILKRLRNNPNYQRIFSREERLNLIIEYQSYIVGKRDCNKFGLMMLKLFYQGREKQFTQFLNSRVDEFIKGIKRRPFNCDYKKLVAYFKLDTSIDENTNIQILKLLSELLEPEMHKRIPMKLFYFKFLRLLRISQYRVIVKPFKPKEALPRQINPDSLNLQICMVEEITSQRRQSLEQIQQVFSNTIKIAREHYQEYAKISESILSSLSNPNNINYTSTKMKNNVISEQSLKVIKNIAEKINSLVKFAWQVLMKVENLICERHGLRVQAECEEPNCRQRWLCSKCLYELLFQPPHDSELAHVKREVSSGRTIVNYHPIAYIGSSRRHRVDVVCLLLQGQAYNFKCPHCLDQTKDLSKYDSIYFINWSKRIFYGPEDTTDNQKQSSIDYTFSARYKINQYKAIFYKLSEMKEKILLESQQIYASLNMVKSMIDKIFKEFGSTYAEISEMIESNSKISKIVEILQYMKMRPILLKELRKHQHDLEAYFRKIRLDQLAKLINSSKGINLLDYCQYFIDRIRGTFEDIYTKTNKIYQDGRQNRQRHVISNRRLFQSAPIILAKFKGNNEKTVSRLEPTGQTLLIRKHIESLKSKQSQPKQILKESKIQVMNSYQSNLQNYNKYDYDICQCKKKEETTSNQKITHFCAAEECNYRFICRSCEQSHDKDHLYGRLQLYVEEEDNQQIEFLLRKIEDMKQSFKVNKILEKMIAQIRIQMVDPIDFIAHLYNNCDQTGKIKELVFEKLKQLIIDNKVKGFGDYLWIISNFISNPQEFMSIIRLQAERYNSCLIEAKRGIKDLYGKLEETPINSILRKAKEEPYFAPYDQEESKMLLDQKYRTIHDFSFQNVQMPLQFVTTRHRKRVQCIQIRGIKQNNIYQSNLEEQSKNQFTKILAYNHYNNFDISLYSQNFKPNHNSFLSNLQNFQNLKKLTIVDQPNWANPIVFKSIQIQQMLVKTHWLQELKLHCLNGFDRYCLEIIKRKHQKCVVDINSLAGRVAEWKWTDRLFQKEPYVDLPFSIDGELMSPFSSQQIVRGEYYLQLTDQTIGQTMSSLASLRKIPANHLRLIFNHLLEHESLDDPFSFFEVKINFWCRITYGTYLTIRLQKQINRRCSAIKPIFPQFNKLVDLKSLTLHGLVVNGGNDNPQAEYVQNSLNQSLSSLKLETLEFVKCFGLKMSVIFQNINTLKRLIIEQCAFKEENMESYPSFVQLQTLIMKRVGLFEINSKNNLLSREMTSFLGRFNITTLSLLVLNDFYELQNKQLEWIQKCPIKKLSLRRCFKITSDIYMLTMRIKGLQDFDITDTDIQQSSFRHKNTGDGKQRLKLYNSVHKIAGEKIDGKMKSKKVMKELSRMANSYHIEHIQNADNMNSLKPLPLNLVEIKEVRLENLKIREKGQYYLMQMLGKLPDLEVFSIINCEWKNRLKIESIKYSQFTFIKELSKLKELSLINVNIKKIGSTWLNAYKYLRKLVLSRNFYLEEISDLDFEELKELNVSDTGLTKISLNFAKLPTILLINLQNTKLSMFPEQLLLSKTIRIIVTSLRHEKDEARTNFRKSANINTPIKQTIRIEDIEVNKILDMQLTQLQDFIQEIVILEDRKGRPQVTSYQQYFGSCLCIDSKKAIESIQNVCFRNLLRFQLFKVEMDVKGIFSSEKIAKFYEQQRQREQWKSQTNKREQQWKEDLQYEIMALESKLQQSSYVYKSFSLRNSHQEQTPIDLILFQNIYSMFKYASEKYNDDYIAAFYPPVREYRDKPFSNYFTKRSTQYQVCRREYISSEYFNPFLEFLWQCNADMNRRNIMNCGMTIDSIGFCKEHKHSLFKVIDVSNCMLIQTDKDSPIYQILQHLVLSRRDIELYKKSLLSLYNFMNLRNSTNSCKAEIKKVFQSLVVSKIAAANIVSKLGQTGKPIINSQQRKELHFYIKDLIGIMQRYKKIVNCYQLMNILKYLKTVLAKETIENMRDRTQKEDKIFSFEKKMQQYLSSQLNDGPQKD